MISYLIETSFTGTLSCFLSLIVIKLFRRSSTAGWGYTLCKINLIFYLLPISTIAGKLMHIRTYDAYSLVENTMLQAQSSLAASYARPQLVLLLWFWVVLILILFYVAMFLFCNNRVRKNSHMVLDVDKLQLLHECSMRLHICTDVKLFLNAAIHTPMTTGVLSHRIYLPETELEPDALDMIFTHELTHIRRRDTWWKWLYLIVRIVHWYNPVVYLLCRRTEHMCETSCDELVAYPLNAAQRKLYGHTMIDMMTKSSNHLCQPFLLPFSQSQELVRKRITVMLTAAIPSRQRRLRQLFSITIFFTLSLFISTAFNPILSNAATTLTTSIGIEANACEECGGDMEVSYFSSDWVPKNISRDCIHYAYGEDEYYIRNEYRKYTCLVCKHAEIVVIPDIEEKWTCFGHRS